MREPFSLIVAGVVGAGLGLFFFGGLWLTVRSLPTARHPVALMLGSLLVRMTVTLTGFYLVAVGQWERLVACVVGFVLVRFVTVAWLRPAASREEGL